MGSFLFAIKTYYFMTRVYKEVITMRLKIAKLVIAAFEIGGIACLTGIAINAECKRHKAEKAKSEAELKATIYEFCNYMDNIKIKDLEEQLEELKAKGEA